MFGAGEMAAAYVIAVIMLALCGLVFLAVATLLEYITKKGM